MNAAAPYASDSSLPARFIKLIGNAVAWLTLAMVLVTFTVVVSRYAFNMGWIWLQDSITYLHACVFMLAAALTLQRDEHVRVDIFYRGKAPRQKALVDALGILLFLMPFCIFLIITSWNYVAVAWKIQEGSREASGLPWVYVLKTLVLVMPALVLLQAGVLLADCWRCLRSGRRVTATA